MMQMKPVDIGGRVAMAIEVRLPKTTLIAVTTDKGYIMCGALDVALLNDKLSDRQIIAGRAVGVRTVEQLLDAPLESVTHEAASRGIGVGTIGRDAIAKMLEWD